MNEDCIYKDFCELNCTTACIRYLEMRYLLKSSNIPKSRQKLNRLVPDDRDIASFEKLADIRDDIETFTKDGGSLYIYSETCGNGKTTWSIKLLLQYFNQIWAGNGFTKRGLFINVPTFLSMRKSTISKPDVDFENMCSILGDVDLVVWDDIATVKLTDFEYGILLSYIDQRVLSGKANIYTGNILPDKLSTMVGERLASRICGEKTIKVRLMGKDMR